METEPLHELRQAYWAQVLALHISIKRGLISGRGASEVIGIAQSKAATRSKTLGESLAESGQNRDKW